MDVRPLRFALTGVLLLWGCSSPVAPDLIVTPTAAAGAAAAASGISASIIDLTNHERTRAGVAPLSPSTRLMQAAQLQADQMASLGRMEHVLMDGPYPMPQDRLAAAGYKWRAFAENIAWGQRSPEHVTDSWMHSDGHRANMLNASYTELGIGYALDEHGRPYFVQLFGRPS